MTVDIDTVLLFLILIVLIVTKWEPYKIWRKFKRLYKGVK